jgi:hypothetical protein
LNLQVAGHQAEIRAATTIRGRVKNPLAQKAGKIWEGKNKSIELNYMNVVSGLVTL